MSHWPMFLAEYLFLKKNRRRRRRFFSKNRYCFFCFFFVKIELRDIFLLCFLLICFALVRLRCAISPLSFCVSPWRTCGAPFLPF